MLFFLLSCYRKFTVHAILFLIMCVWMLLRQLFVIEASITLVTFEPVLPGIN